jgi:phage terminase large subunit-like protein
LANLKTKTRKTSSSIEVKKVSYAVDPVTAWAQEVYSGKVLAGPDIRNACGRHLRDLEDGPKRGLTWDLEKANRAIRYFKTVLKLNGGEHEGLPFVLLPWQAFIVGSIFGWMAPDGFRRFRTCYIESGKGSGKSPLAAGIGLYCLTSDNEPRAEVYAAATKRDQAMILFRDAVAMVDQSPTLKKKIKKSGRDEKVWNLAYLATGSFFRPISSDDGQSGPRPHCALIDEVHEHKNNKTVEFMRAGTKGRRQALILMITNSGHDRNSVCYSYHQLGVNVCEAGAKGVTKRHRHFNDGFFSFICSLDKGDDPFKDEKCWGKANPSLGHTFQPKYLREQVTDAKGMPAKASTVRRLNFCQWVDAANPWIDIDTWLSCCAKFDPEKLAGQICYGGLDLSGKRDLTALNLYFPEQGKSIAEFWTPKDTLLDRAAIDGVPYDIWLEDGHIHAPPGKAINYAFVAKRLGELAAKYEIKALAFDPYHMTYLEVELEAQGIELNLVPHGQGFRPARESNLWMTHSIDLVEDLILTGQIQVLANPCLTWNVASAVMEADAQENRIFSKRKKTGRIDGAVAMAMAVGAANTTEKVAESLSDHITKHGIRTL